MMLWLLVALWLVVEFLSWVIVHSELRRRRAVKAREPERNDDIRVVCIVIGSERYVFYLTDTPANRQIIIDTADRYAADPDLSFTAAAATAVADQLQPIAKRCNL